MTVQFVIRGGLSVDVPDPFTPSFGKMTKSGGAQSIPDLAVNALITFDTSVYSTPVGLVDIANEQFVISATGIYLITAMIEWAPAVIAAGEFKLSAFVGGVKIGEAVNVVSTVGSTVGRSNIVATAASLVAGNLITFRASQASGAPQDIARGEATIQRVG